MTLLILMIYLMTLEMTLYFLVLQFLFAFWYNLKQPFLHFL